MASFFGTKTVEKRCKLNFFYGHLLEMPNKVKINLNLYLFV
jgi:hypothetical protein